jgi:hypothetical protein
LTVHTYGSLVLMTYNEVDWSFCESIKGKGGNMAAHLDYKCVRKFIKMRVFAQMPFGNLYHQPD